MEYRNKLKGTIPDNVIDQIQTVIDKFEINTPLRLAHFLAQCSHESAGFTVTKENLNYSGDALYKLFKSHFKDQNDANAYARQPEKIADRIYASRMGNGDEKSGDGYKYRGRGYIQLTGKTNYDLFTKSIGDDCITHPELLESKYALASAGWFFKKINTIADKGSDTATITAVTKAINGGTIGLDDRTKQFNKIYSLLK